MTDSSDPFVSSMIRDGCATLTLNRPDTLNALSVPMVTKLMGELTRLEKDPACRAIALQGAGRSFCAGQDLRDRDPRGNSPLPDLSRTVRETYAPLIRKLRTLQKPIVASVHGVAAGAGIGIALACDISVVAEDAQFVFAFSRIGLVPDAGTSWALVRRLGEARAMDLALCGGTLSGYDAAACGLVSRACPADELITQTNDVTNRLARGAATGLMLTKKAIRAASVNGLDEQLDLEAELQGEAGRDPDYAEGVLAFLEKRQPRFFNTE